MLRALPLVIAILALALAPAGPAHAQRVMDIERFTPAPDGDGFLTIPGTRTPGPWRWNVALWLGYANMPLTLRLPTGERIGIVSDRIGGDLLFQLGVLGRFAVVVDAPVALWQQGDPSVLDGDVTPLQVIAIRDPRIAMRARLLGEDATVERERHEGEGLALQVAGTIPIGMENAFAGEGAPQLEASLIGDFHLLDFGIGANLGFRHRFAEPVLLGVPFRNELFFGVGIQIPAWFFDNRLLALAEVDVVTDAENAFGNVASTSVEWLLGIRGRLRDLDLSLAGGTGLTGGVGATTFRIVAGVSWAPRVHDRDHDGIHDDQDAGPCQTLPEDFDGYQDEDGCPEPDNDGDLVPDLDDRCPDAAATFGEDLDDDGCNDPNVDADGDGVQDGADLCADTREDADGHEDADGCLDPDDDGDGVLDEADACRAEPEDADGHADEDGCPDADDDEDGVLDEADACRAAAEDRDGHGDEDGCPDPDDDRDGVLDPDDRCADQLEDLDGRADEDGCPEPGGRAAWRRTGTPGQSDLVLEGTLRFAADGSLPATAAPALDQLARQLRSAWGTRLRIVIGRGTEPQAAALRAALETRAVDLQTVEIVNDPAVRGVRVVAVP